MSKSEQPAEDHWDDAFALRLPGKIVLVGMTYLDTAGNLDRQEQFYGKVVEADRAKGIRLLLTGTREGQHYGLPPQTSNLVAAKPGLYTLHATGEVVEDPDFISTWTITKDG